MICVKLFGGLGNQMFQYAIGRSISHKLNTTLAVDTSFFAKNNLKNHITDREYELSIFDLALYEILDKELKHFKPIKYRLLNSISYRLGLGVIQFPSYFFEKNIGYNNAVNIINSKSYLSGYWQSYKYFDEIEGILRKDFRFPNILDDKGKSLSSLISEVNSVSIHIRRGDFVKNPSNHVHSLCSIDYYRNAIKYIDNKFHENRFFIFSDDIEWVKKNLPMKDNSYFICGNLGRKSYLDMQLMSLCKHNIIANSSFSWWGAWLNKNPNKIIIAPKKWYNNEQMNNQTIDLIPREWVRM